MISVDAVLVGYTHRVFIHAGLSMLCSCCRSHGFGVSVVFTRSVMVRYAYVVQVSSRLPVVVHVGICAHTYMYSRCHGGVIGVGACSLHAVVCA